MGPGRHRRRAGGCSSGRCAASASGRTSCRPPIAACHAVAPPDRRHRLAPDRRGCTTSSSRSSRRRWCASTARSRWRWPTGPEAGLDLVDELGATGDLAGHHLSPPPGPTCCAGPGRPADAEPHYRAALAATDNEAERRYLARRLAECVPPPVTAARLTGSNGRVRPAAQAGEEPGDRSGQRLGRRCRGPRPSSTSSRAPGDTLGHRPARGDQRTGARRANDHERGHLAPASARRSARCRGRSPPGRTAACGRWPRGRAGTARRAGRSTISSGMPMARWNASTASPRRPAPDEVVESAAQPSLPAVARSGAVNGGSNSTRAVTPAPAAAARSASAAPDECPNTAAEPPAAAITAARSSTSRSGA